MVRDESDPAPAPSTPPAGLKVSGAVTRVLTWDAVEGATSYDVRYSARNYAFNDPNKWDPWVLCEGIAGTTHRLLRWAERSGGSPFVRTTTRARRLV